MYTVHAMLTYHNLAGTSTVEVFVCVCLCQLCVNCVCLLQIKDSRALFFNSSATG